MPSVRELFATIGMDVDTTGFIKAQLATDAIRYGLTLLRDGLQDAARGMVNLVLTSAQAADDISDLSDRTGVSADSLQRLGYGAKLSGVSMDQLAVAMNFMAKKGIKDVEGGFSKLADQIQALPDDGSRAKAAIKALGKAGGALVPFLKRGAAGLKELGDEAEAIGWVMDETTLKQGGAFADTWDAIGMAVTAAGRQLAFQFIPDLLEVARAVLGWVKANKELIKTRVRAIALGIAEGFEKVWKAIKVVWALLRPFRAGIGWLADKLGTVNLVLGAFTLLIGVPMLAALGSFAASLYTVAAAATWASIATALIPLAIGALIFVLVGLLALFAEDLYQFFTGGDSMFGDFLFALKEVGVAIWDAIAGAFQRAAAFVVGVWNSLIDWIVEKVTGLGSAISNGVKSGLRAVGGLIPGGTMVVDSMFGGGASPAASVAASSGGQSVVNAPQFNAGGFVINATPGMSEQSVADLTAQRFEDFLATKNREALAAVGEAP